MRILIDADSCPVLDIAQEIARKNDVELLIFADLNHNLTINYGQKIVVDQKSQSVDMKIFNMCKPGDIVITQDYGLASLVLGKEAIPVSTKGKIFSDNNIKYLLMRRHNNAKIRRATGRHHSHKKRQKKDDLKFEKILKKLIKI